jgi:hypothetical protein
MEMYCIKREEIEGFLELNGAQILDVVQNQSQETGWISYRYYAMKIKSHESNACLAALPQQD